MIQNISVGKYLPGDSIIHKLDPRTKLLIFFLMTIVIFWVRSLSALILISMGCGILMKLTNISAVRFVKNNKTLIFVSLTTAFINLMFEAQARLITSGKFYVSQKGIKLSCIMIIKLITLMITTSSIMFTTSPTQIAYSVEKILAPFEFLGINSRDIALTITITLKFIPTVFEETTKIINAQRARGANFKTRNILKFFKNLLSVLVPLLVSSLRRADSLALAIESRCYDSSKPHSTFKSYKFKPVDFAAILITFILILGVIGCNLWIKI